MPTFEIREYTDKETGKTRKRIRVKIRLKGFAPEEATFDNLEFAKAWASKREYELRYQQQFGVQAFKTKTIKDLLHRYGEALAGSNPLAFA